MKREREIYTEKKCKSETKYEKYERNVNYSRHELAHMRN